MPRVVFEKPGKGLAMWVQGDNVIHVPTNVVPLARFSPSSPYGSFVKEGIIHETAHTMQNAGTLAHDPTLVEGGAQAYADRAGAQVIPGLVPYDGIYSGITNRMRTLEPSNWITKGQFNPNATNAPTIAAPNTPDFGHALRGLSRAVASRISGTGNRTVQQAYVNAWQQRHHKIGSRTAA